MCWMAIGFLLIITFFVQGRSYQEENNFLHADEKNVNSQERIFLEGIVSKKEYKESVYGDYLQVVLKDVVVKTMIDGKANDGVEPKEYQPGKTIKKMEGRYLCQIQSQTNLEVKIGQRLLVEAKYTPWEEPTNEGQFNTKKYYISQGILGQFKKGIILNQSSEYSVWQENMWNLREKIQLFLLNRLGNKDGALISAMLLGDKNQLETEDKSLYQRNGISHIMAISGMHLSLLGMGVYKVIEKILSAKKPAAIITIIIMSLYCIFKGNSIYTIRATIMFALSLLAILLGRSYDSLSALGFTAILQLFFNPYVLNNSGFLLSFLAVLGVTFVAPALQELLEVKTKIMKSICVSVAATLTTLPVLLVNYGNYPWYSVFLNLFILPAMSVLLFLAIFLILVGMILGLQDSIEIILCWGIGRILDYFEMCCKTFEGLFFQDGYLGAPSKLQIIFYGAILVFVLYPKRQLPSLVRKMLLLSAISILLLRFTATAEVTMLDVGQGDGVVICNSNGNVYISDCGSSSVSKVGKYRLLPFLKYKGYGKIKGIFVSHLDEDHMNGIQELLEVAQEEHIEIEYLFFPKSVLDMENDGEKLEEILLLASQTAIQVIYLGQGDKMQDGKMMFKCLYPLRKSGEEYAEDDRNNQSLVILMTYNEFDMILTGDVEREGETEIIQYIDQNGFLKDDILEKKSSFQKETNKTRQNSEEQRKIDVLKTAHHGSNGSSSEKFLKVIQPKLSLISYGKNNSYGHPHGETLERLEACGSKILTTVDCGAITLKIGRKRIEIKCFKKDD